MIRIEHLKAGYSGKIMLDIDSLAFDSGKMTAIVGLNGSGKSTLLKAILGMHLYEGTVQLDGKDLHALSYKERARKIAYLPQLNQVNLLDVFTLVSHGRFPYLGFSKVLGKRDKELVENALRLTDMWDKRDKSVSALSGGEQQRAYLAMIIAQDTKMILLDEPTTYMDIKHQVEMLAVLKQLSHEGRGIILTSHDLPQSFSECDEVRLIHSGKIVASGTSADVLSDRNTIRNVMGVGLQKTQGDGCLYKYSLVL